MRSRILLLLTFLLPVSVFAGEVDVRSMTIEGNFPTLYHFLGIFINISKLHDFPLDEALQ